MSKNFPLRRLPGKVVQQQTPSPKSRNFGQSYQRSDGYSYTFKQIPTRLTVYRRDASTLRPLTDRRKPAVQHLHTPRYEISSQTLDNRTRCACAELASYYVILLLGRKHSARTLRMRTVSDYPGFEYNCVPHCVQMLYCWFSSVSLWTKSDLP